MIRYIIIATTLVAASHSVKEYRSDFEYSPQTDAFYKLHTEIVSYSEAVDTCKGEGAVLVGPFPKDVVEAHGLLKQFPDIGERIWADNEEHQLPAKFDENEFGRDTGVPDFNMCKGITRYGDIEKLACFNEFPFICKVSAKDAIYDPQCKVYATGYQYLENLGSCYKISSAAFSWDQAFAECRAEGAHLLVLNSDLEHQAVHNLTHRAPKPSANAHSPWYWFAGIRAQRTTDGSPGTFKTIFGQTLQEAGYNEWSVGEPNNLGGNELCGSIFTNDGKYNDLNCSHRFAFICEKNIQVEDKSR